MYEVEIRQRFHGRFTVVKRRRFDTFLFTFYTTTIAKLSHVHTKPLHTSVKYITLNDCDSDSSCMNKWNCQFLSQINGHFVLNSPLEPVIAAMQESNTVTMVVARAKDPEAKSEVSIHPDSVCCYDQYRLVRCFSRLVLLTNQICAKVSESKTPRSSTFGSVLFFLLCCFLSNVTLD